ncbi:MAG: FeoB-associated Cys-rich membrane protein [Clostridia bacterium]|nr:FeoB-associated Cys-rich membrane protein [Clostridia bacterium]
MLAWLAANLANLLIVALLLAVVTLIIVRLAKNKKRGTTACGCGCANCAMRDACHPKS